MMKAPTAPGRKLEDETLTWLNQGNLLNLRYTEFVHMVTHAYPPFSQSFLLQINNVPIFIQDNRMKSLSKGQINNNMWKQEKLK